MPEFFWRMANGTCLEVSLTTNDNLNNFLNVGTTDNVDNSATSGIPVVPHDNNDDEVDDDDDSVSFDRPTKRRKIHPGKVQKEPESMLMWESALRARIWINRDLLFDDHEATTATSTFVTQFWEQALDAIGYHAPNLQKCVLYSATGPTLSQHQQQDQQQPHVANVTRVYFPVKALTSLLRRAKALKRLHLIGIVGHAGASSSQDMALFEQVLQRQCPCLEQLHCVENNSTATTDTDTDTAATAAMDARAAWTASLLCAHQLKSLHLEGSPLLLNGPRQALVWKHLVRHQCCNYNNILVDGNDNKRTLPQLYYLRLDMELQPDMVVALLELIQHSTQLSHLSLGLTVTSQATATNASDVTNQMKALAKAVGNSHLDLVTLRLHKDLFAAGGLQQCWISNLQKNNTVTYLQVLPMKNSCQDSNTATTTTTTTNASAVVVPKEWNTTIQALLEMNRKAMKRVYATHLSHETSEGWARSLSEICAADLPEQHILTCLYSYLRTKPAELINQLVQNATPRPSLGFPMRGRREWNALLRMEKNYYDLAYKLASLREREVCIQKNAVDTNEKWVTTLGMMAQIKQFLSSRNAARIVTPALQRAYGNGQRLVVEIENHCETFGESLEIFLNDDSLKGLRKEVSELRLTIQSLFQSLEQAGVAF